MHITCSVSNPLLVVIKVDLQKLPLCFDLPMKLQLQPGIIFIID